MNQISLYIKHREFRKSSSLIQKFSKYFSHDTHFIEIVHSPPLILQQKHLSHPKVQR